MKRQKCCLAGVTGWRHLMCRLNMCHLLHSQTFDITSSCSVLMHQIAKSNICVLTFFWRHDVILCLWSSLMSNGWGWTTASRPSSTDTDPPEQSSSNEAVRTEIHTATPPESQRFLFVHSVCFLIIPPVLSYS